MAAEKWREVKLDSPDIRFKRKLEQLSQFDSFSTSEYYPAHLLMECVDIKEQRWHHEICRHDLRYVIATNAHGGCSRSRSGRASMQLYEVFEWFSEIQQKSVDIRSITLVEPR